MVMAAATSTAAGSASLLGWPISLDSLLVRPSAPVYLGRLNRVSSCRRTSARAQLLLNWRVDHRVVVDQPCGAAGSSRRRQTCYVRRPVEEQASLSQHRRGQLSAEGMGLPLPIADQSVLGQPFTYPGLGEWVGGTQRDL